MTGRFKGSEMCHVLFPCGEPCNFQSFIIKSSQKMQILNSASGRKQSGRYLTLQLMAAKWESWAGTSQIPQRSPLASMKTSVLQVWEHSALFYPTCLNERQIQRQISCSHFRNIIPSLRFLLGLISTQRRNNMKSRVWGSAQTGSSNMSSQAELAQTEISPILLHRQKPASASFSPIFSGSWKEIALYRKTHPQKPSPEQNQSYFFTPEWKYIPSISLIFRKIFHFQ